MKRAITTQKEIIMNDAQNPAYLFQGIDTTLLTAIVNGSLDAVATARKELANRGLNAEGKWVGFKAAAELHGVHA